MRRGEHVHATDGEIGLVQGLVAGRPPRDPRAPPEGHLRGRKNMAVPVSAVTGVDDGIRLNITKQQVPDLPPVDIDHPDG